MNKGKIISRVDTLINNISVNRVTPNNVVRDNEVNNVVRDNSVDSKKAFNNPFSMITNSHVIVDSNNINQPQIVSSNYSNYSMTHIVDNSRNRVNSNNNRWNEVSKNSLSQLRTNIIGNTNGINSNNNIINNNTNINPVGSNPNSQFNNPNRQSTSNPIKQIRHSIINNNNILTNTHANNHIVPPLPLHNQRIINNS